MLSLNQQGELKELEEEEICAIIDSLAQSYVRFENNETKREAIQEMLEVFHK